MKRRLSVSNSQLLQDELIVLPLSVKSSGDVGLNYLFEEGIEDFV